MKRFLKTLVWCAAIATCLLAQGQGNGNGNGKGKGGTTNPGNSGNPGNGNGGDTATETSSTSGTPLNGNTIEWLVPETSTAADLLDAGVATVEFKSKVDLEDVAVWLTPSLKGLVADPLLFETITKDTVYSIELTLEDPPTHTLGGTLHLRSTGGRSLARPLPLNIKVQGSDDPSEDEDDSDDNTVPVVSAVASSTNYRTGSVTAGETVSLFGQGLGPKTGKTPELDSNGRVANYLGDTQVLFNGLPAPVLAASNGQVNVVVPQGIAADTSTSIVLTFQGNVSREIILPVTPASPALFTLDGTGQGQGAVLNQDRTVNSASKPARRGSAITLYGSGFGAWATPIPDGTVMGSELPSPKAPVTVTIGGAAAKVLYAGGAPGMVSGIVQINAEIPANITPGDKVTVVVTVGSQSSPANVTVSVQ